MLVAVFSCNDEFVCSKKYGCFKVFVAVGGALASEVQTGDGAGVSGEFWVFSVAPDGGWELLEESFTYGLGDVLWDKCFRDG